jgi:hypothetical protein
MSEPPISYIERPDATPEAQHSALAAVYRFALDCYAKKKAAPESRPDDEKGRSSNDSLASNHSTT